MYSIYYNGLWSTVQSSTEGDMSRRYLFSVTLRISDKRGHVASYPLTSGAPWESLCTLIET